MKSRPWILDAVFASAALGLGLGLRLSLLDFKSIDYFNYTKVWYNTLRDTGFAAFGQGFSNYNLPYLYMLYVVVRLLPGLPVRRGDESAVARSRLRGGLVHISNCAPSNTRPLLFPHWRHLRCCSHRRWS